MQIPPDRMTQPGVNGGGEWSVKDLMAHVNWVEQETIGILETHAFGGENAALWQMPIDSRNAIVFERNRHRSLEDVQADVQTTFARLIGAIEGLTDEDFTDSSRFGYIPRGLTIDQVIAINTFDHYAQHIDDLRAWV